MFMLHFCRIFQRGVHVPVTMSVRDPLHGLGGCFTESDLYEENRRLRKQIRHLKAAAAERKKVEFSKLIFRIFQRGVHVPVTMSVRDPLHGLGGCLAESDRGSDIVPPAGSRSGSNET